MVGVLPAIRKLLILYPRPYRFFMSQERFDDVLELEAVALKLLPTLFAFYGHALDPVQREVQSQKLSSALRHIAKDNHMNTKDISHK